MTNQPPPSPPHGTLEGHTKERPAAEEVGRAGAPGAPGGDIDHAAEGHMDAHAGTSDDDHGHAEAPLGPIDWPAWGYAVLGVAAGLVVVLAFWLARA